MFGFLKDTVKDRTFEIALNTLLGEASVTAGVVVAINMKYRVATTDSLRLFHAAGVIKVSAALFIVMVVVNIVRAIDDLSAADCCYIEYSVYNTGTVDLS